MQYLLLQLSVGARDRIKTQSNPTAEKFHYSQESLVEIKYHYITAPQQKRIYINKYQTIYNIHMICVPNKFWFSL